MNTLPPPSSPPTLSRKNVSEGEGNEDNQYRPRTMYLYFTNNNII